jgi:hypothetical protein
MTAIKNFYILFISKTILHSIVTNTIDNKIDTVSQFEVKKTKNNKNHYILRLLSYR